MSEHVNVSYRCLGGIRVTSSVSQYVDLLALRSDCPSIQYSHPTRAHRERARKVAVVNVGDDQASISDHFQEAICSLLSFLVSRRSSSSF